MIFTIDRLIHFDLQYNKKNPKFKVGNHVRISKYKNGFAKYYTPNQTDETFVIEKASNTVPWTYNIDDLIDENIVEIFQKKQKKSRKRQAKNNSRLKEW